MHLPIPFNAILAISGVGVGVAARRPTVAERRNATDAGTIDEIVLAYLRMTSPNSTVITSSSPSFPFNIFFSYSPDEILPIRDLPRCYQKCFDSECCNAWHVPDVRKLTVYEFCKKEAFYTGNWMAEHFQECTGRNCWGECEDRCQAWGMKWLYDMCGPWLAETRAL